MVFAMSKSNLIAFRIPSELQDEFNRSVLASGGGKTSWLVDAIRMKLGQPEKSIDSVSYTHLTLPTNYPV